MSTVRIQTGDTEELRSRFVNAQGAGVTGLAPTVRIWRVSDGQFWNGTGYAASPTNHAMSAVDATNLPGVYAYDFDTSAGGGASEEEHGVLSTTSDASVINPDQEASVHVGGFIDNLDAAVSSRAVPGDAMALVANALTAAAVATDAIDADALATNAVNEIRDAVLNALLGSGESLAVTLQNVARILGLDSSHTVTFTPSQVSVAPDGGGADVIVQSIGGNGETLTTVDRTT